MVLNIFCLPQAQNDLQRAVQWYLFHTDGSYLFQGEGEPESRTILQVHF